MVSGRIPRPSPRRARTRSTQRFDRCVSASPFRPGHTRATARLLAGHKVSTAYELGWSSLENGELLAAAERDGFEVLVTTDRHLRFQQNLAARRIGMVVLTSTSWPRIRRELSAAARAVDEAVAGSYVEVAIA